RTLGFGTHARCQGEDRAGAERRRRRGRLRAAQNPARGAAGGPGAHGHEARLRVGRVRHLYRVARRHAGPLLSGARPRLRRAPGKEPSGLRVVGKAHRKVDATAKVTGVTRFADDLFLPRMLFAKLLRSPHPHARILSIDPSRAASVPGVKAVLTGKDLPIPFG